MDESATLLGVRRKLAGSRILQTLDDSSLSRSVQTYDERERRVERYGHRVLVVEGANSKDGELIELRHDGQTRGGPRNLFR